MQASVLCHVEVDQGRRFRNSRAVFRPSRTRFPELTTTAPRHPHQSLLNLTSLSLIHCSGHAKVRSITVPPCPLIAGKPAGATAQLHRLLPISATAPSLLNTAGNRFTTPKHVLSSLSTTQWLALHLPPALLASSPNRIPPCAHSPSSG